MTKKPLFWLVFGLLAILAGVRELFMPELLAKFFSAPSKTSGAVTLAFGVILVIFAWWLAFRRGRPGA